MGLELEERKLCGCGSGMWGMGLLSHCFGYSMHGAGEGETRVQEGERGLLAPLLGCSESGRRRSSQPLFLVGCVHGRLWCCVVAHPWVIFCTLGAVLRGLWGPTASGDVRVGFTVLAQGEMLRMEGARFGLSPAWGGKGVAGSCVAGAGELWVGNVCVERGSSGTVVVGTCV